MYQCQVPIGSLPVSIVLLSSGELVFIRTSAFRTIAETGTPDKIEAIFDEEGFNIGNCRDMCYNVKYNIQEKELADVKLWLQQQRIPHPDAKGEYIEK